MTLGAREGSAWKVRLVTEIGSRGKPHVVAPSGSVLCQAGRIDDGYDDPWPVSFRVVVKRERAAIVVLTVEDFSGSGLARRDLRAVPVSALAEMARLQIAQLHIEDANSHAERERIAAIVTEARGLDEPMEVPKFESGKSKGRPPKRSTRTFLFEFSKLFFAARDKHGPRGFWPFLLEDLAQLNDGTAPSRQTAESWKKLATDDSFILRGYGGSPGPLFIEFEERERREQRKKGK